MRVSRRRQEKGFQVVVTVLTKDRHVTRETRQGFGSGALKVKGKIFAMIASKDQFVVKLPKTRVDALVQDGVGGRFEPGPGRVMKEWLAIDAKRERVSWLDLAREAHQFVKTKA